MIQEQPNVQTTKQARSWKRMVGLVIQLLFGMTVILYVANDLAYVGAWVLGGLYVFSYVVFFLGLPKELASTRGKRIKNSPLYEKIIRFVMILLGYGVYVVAGFDHKLGWTIAMPWFMLWIAGFIFLIGMGIVFSAMRENAHFNQMVSKDEHHQVIDTGPYSIIRHPGYLGMVTYLSVVPIILGSLYAMIPTIGIIILFLIRTHLEDNYLSRHMEGYQAYKDKVTKRLFRSFKS